MTVYGNDDSHWNGKRDYAIARAKGAQFNISKASEGRTYQDDTFVHNYTAAQKVHKINGAYHFFHPGISASQQIVNFSTALKQVDWSPKSLLVVDYEVSDGQAASVCAGRLKSFCKELLALYSNPVLVYTSPSVWGAIGNKDTFWTQFGLWIANYGVSEPIVPKPWSKWAIWQFSDKGTGSAWGASSQYIDINIMADWYWQIVVPAEPPPPPAATVPDTLSGSADGVTYTWRLE